MNVCGWKAGLATLLLCGVARADVSWEHVASVRTSTLKKPAANFKIYNQWTAQRHRVVLKFAIPSVPGFDMPRIPGTSFPLPALTSTVVRHQPKGSRYGGVTTINRLDDDRRIAFSSESHSYISESRRGLIKKLRFDPWRKVGPRLSEEMPPAFSTEQRQRLGAEVRAATRPFLKKVFKIYFRPLTQTRNFNGITGKGYRMTWLLNAGGIKPRDSQWVHINFEWWIADDLPGDEDIRSYVQASRDTMRDIAWPSTSLWINEFWPVLWQTMPQELLMAADTLMPAATSARAGFGGTPLRFNVTILPPPLQRAQSGEVRFELALTRRETRPLPAAIFDAPAGFERVPIDPKLKDFDKILHPEMAKGTPAPREPDAMGFTWQAWDEYVGAVKQAAPGLPR